MTEAPRAIAGVRRPPTEDPRMWDAFVGAGVVVLLVVACFAGTPAAIAQAAAGVLAVGAGYLLRRRAMLADIATPGFQLAAIAGAAVAAHAYGPMGAVQALAAPLLWVSSGASTRRAVVANAGLFGGVLVAFWLRGDAVLLLATTQALSFAFSMVIGLWISGLARANEERERLIGELEQAQASIARLSGERATAAERARIARDLHDTIAQDLTGIAMLAQRSDPDAETVRSIEALAQDALAEVRGIVAAHGGVGLDDGLPVALERLGARFQAETGIAVTVAAPPVDLPVDAQVALLRTAQESLANVRKHAQATSAAIELRADASGAVLRIADDGRGFDRATITRGLGLHGLDERMALAGGSLEVDSSPAGTTVTARLARGGGS
ncbi:sensor histidine kinase [Agrococcus carbonis]|uniref:histidine kinase n=1 Tax=Agrococcus carbonis TaxID=684552 RepID=A0A1H1MPS1_9MICO|nr:sensor histidine kinase [Agrococcus carbonis]SDR87909.1 Signal transduction histidine kinase [Agrococcus carbonis]